MFDIMNKHKNIIFYKYADTLFTQKLKFRIPCKDYHVNHLYSYILSFNYVISNTLELLLQWFTEADMGPYQILVLTVISITAAKVHVHVFKVFFVQHKHNIKESVQCMHTFTKRFARILR